MEQQYLVHIENINGKLTGSLAVNGNLNEITFNPLNILGELLFIANDYKITNNISNICIEKSVLFQSPYPIETCFNINVEHDVQYFSLLNTLKEIIVNNQKPTFQEVYKIGLFYKISLNYNFSLENFNPEPNELTLYTPMVFGLCKLSEIFTIDIKNHMYDCTCSSISEIVFSIFSYLILFNYCFFKCKHCQKYFAAKRKQGQTKYCTRENMLSLQEYKDLSCADAVPLFLESIRNNKKKVISYLYNRACDDEINLFSNGYNDINDLVKSEQSAPNLLRLNKYVDDSYIKFKKYVYDNSIKLKKKRG